MRDAPNETALAFRQNGRGDLFAFAEMTLEKN
jgi:hypothetical protein